MNISRKLMMFGFAASVAGGGALIAEHEGQVLSSYSDPVGVLTSCYGHTGAELKDNQTFTEKECLEQLATDLSQHNYQLMKLTSSIELSNSEHGAYLSFIYNVGHQAFADSTLRKKLLAGDRVGACHELIRWVYADGRKLNGLINRRESERQLCLRGIDAEPI
ncbi:lysozyme [Shewanella surugensis]|uniref:Lysozyme n=1 Tax=Shewanella surugensis TaxID=212020 RepID=A0ABT0L9J2_9GAMM|nr:lysozyme [Shewanella surugensis]MCL1124224.1 lysozyme [Shewanella surugensis]